MTFIAFVFLALAFSSSPSPSLAIQPFFLFFAPFRCVALFFKSCLQVCNAIFFNYNSLAIYFWPRVSPPRPSSCFRFSLRNCNWQFMCRTREREREMERKRGWGSLSGATEKGASSICIVAEGATHILTGIEIEYEIKWNWKRNEWNRIVTRRVMQNEKKKAVAGRETNGIEIELDECSEKVWRLQTRNFKWNERNEEYSGECRV